MLRVLYDSRSMIQIHSLCPSLLQTTLSCCYRGSQLVLTSGATVCRLPLPRDARRVSQSVEWRIMAATTTTKKTSLSLQRLVAYLAPACTRYQWWVSYPSANPFNRRIPVPKLQSRPHLRRTDGQFNIQRASCPSGTVARIHSMDYRTHLTGSS